MPELRDQVLSADSVQTHHSYELEELTRSIPNLSVSC